MSVKSFTFNGININLNIGVSDRLVAAQNK